jgi:hypothetical protein
MRRRVDLHLKLPPSQCEAGAEEIFRDLAVFTARVIRKDVRATDSAEIAVPLPIP